MAGGSPDYFTIDGIIHNFTSNICVVNGIAHIQSEGGIFSYTLSTFNKSDAKLFVFNSYASSPVELKTSVTDQPIPPNTTVYYRKIN